MPERRDLSAAQRRRLHELELRLVKLEATTKTVRRQWLALVEQAGPAAIARELGVTRQAVSSRRDAIRKL